MDCLVFETVLEQIEGVPLPSSITQPLPDSNSTPSPSPEGSKDGPQSSNGECKLLGHFAILVQGALGALALLSLVWKRYRERPRRPVKIWFFDVSKQVVGSIMLHAANVFLSMLSSGVVDIQSAAPTISSTTDIIQIRSAAGEYDTPSRQRPNPCSFYLLNLGIDTTLGIAILVFFLRILHPLFAMTPLAKPPGSLESGNYGSPPQWRWWAKQSLIYFLGLLCMKFIVFLLFQIFPWLGWVGDWALRWTEGREWVQITFVMLVFPLVMNAAQYWIIDSFIKDQSMQWDYQALGNGDAGSTGGGGVGFMGNGEGAGACGLDDAEHDESRALMSATHRNSVDGLPAELAPKSGRVVVVQESVLDRG